VRNKKILIIDEHGFSYICAALLRSDGFRSKIVQGAGDTLSQLDAKDIGLIVTSYSYGLSYFGEIKKWDVPVLILSDNIDQNLLNTLGDFENSYCMIKPLNYGRFRDLVMQLMSGDIVARGGYSIV
jgi:hypothetical protein